LQYSLPFDLISIMVNQWWNVLDVPCVTTSLVKHSIHIVEM